MLDSDQQKGYISASLYVRNLLLWLGCLRRMAMKILPPIAMVPNDLLPKFKRIRTRCTIKRKRGKAVFLEDEATWNTPC